MWVENPAERGEKIEAKHHGKCLLEKSRGVGLGHSWRGWPQLGAQMVHP